MGAWLCFGYCSICGLRLVIVLWLLELWVFDVFDLLIYDCVDSMLVNSVDFIVSFY